MKVRFKRPFYDNDVGRFEEGTVHELDDCFAAKGRLPRDAEIIEGPKVASDAEIAAANKRSAAAKKAAATRKARRAKGY